ncbi:cyclic nucleotide-binding domain-containing protein [Candidatus Dependentiae bacterium]|nr:cyclic nucleotide-binding domain-containing protein [Candidatus Dependentiae bacterium]
MKQEQIIEFLKKVSLFENLSNEDLNSLSKKIKLENFEKKSMVFKENEPGNKLYILIEGKLVLSKNIENKEKVVAVIIPVNPVGEMSILDDEPRSLTVKTVADSKLLSLEKEDFKEMVRNNPEISFKIFKILSSRLREATQLLKSQRY